MASPIQVQSSLSFAWKTFKARPWLFVGTVIIYAAVQFVLGFLIHSFHEGIQFLISLPVNTLLTIGFMSLYLKAHDDLKSASFKDLWSPKTFGPYLLTSMTVSIIVTLGLLLLVVPGIILALAFSMTPYLVIEERSWGLKAMKESWNMTKGNWLSLLLLGLVIFVINFLGVLLLMVGLIVTVPISILAMTHVYRTLSAKAALTPAASEPAAPAAA